MELKNNIIERAKKIWPDNWEMIIQKYEDKEKNYVYFSKQQKKKIPTPKKQFINLLKEREELKKWELEVLHSIIPKDQLKDGVTYVAMEGTSRLCRCVQEARWDEKEQKFWYTRTKFSYTFEDTMDHFADVIDDGIAGFTPIKEKKDD